MRVVAAAVFLVGIFILSAVSSKAENKIIYGEDDRVEYYQVPEKFRAASDSIVSIWMKDQVAQSTADGDYVLSAPPIMEKQNLCPGVRFREQPSGPFCSGTLVGEDLVLTAGHCIKSKASCQNRAFVFGYALRAAGEPVTLRAGADDVYYCSKIVKLMFEKTTVPNSDGQPQTIYGQDFALIKLDRKVIGRQPLAVNRAGGISEGAPVVSMGYPLGLPLKFSQTGTVFKPVDNGNAYFTTNLDTFGGNSGSPVFNAVTGLMEGVAVRADNDHFLTTSEGCQVYVVKPQTSGTGVIVNKLDLLLNDIPAAPEEAAAGVTLDGTSRLEFPEEVTVGAALDAANHLGDPTQIDINFDF
ncbi:MAG: serine protease [Elusimicrobiota bacterium]